MDITKIRITQRHSIDGRTIEETVDLDFAITAPTNFIVGSDEATDHIEVAVPGWNVGQPRLEWSATLGNGKKLNYADAEKACAALGEGWRLPTRMELDSILDFTRHDPAVDTERFPDTKSDWYWSSTPCAWSSAYAWIVHFSYGSSSSYHRGGSYAFVRAVRSVPAGE